MTGRVSSSFRQGIWMMSFIGRPIGRYRVVTLAPAMNRADRFAKAAFALLCIGSLVGFLVYPTYPNYDSYYSLLWGREVLDLQAPTFEGFRVPTEHPLAIVAGAALSLLGDVGDRVWIALIIASYLWLVAAVYRLGRIAFTPLIGALAAVLLLTRFDYAFLTARGYIDIPYMAMVVWAAALEAERPRRGTPVLVLLALAGLLRPEAWVLAALYWCWVAWKASWGQRIRYAVLAAAGPVLWAATDFAVTGDPLFSLHYTSSSAEELGRNLPLSQLPSAIPEFFANLVKLPVLVAAVLGLAIAILAVPRRAAAPLALLTAGIVTFVLIGIAGASAIERYLAVAAVALLVFAAVTFGGFTLLEEGRLRRGWMAASILVLARRGRVDGLPPQPQPLRRRAELPRRRPRRPREGAARPGGAQGPALRPADAAQPQARAGLALDRRPALREGPRPRRPEAEAAAAQGRRDLRDEPLRAVQARAHEPQRLRADPGPAAGLRAREGDPLLHGLRVVLMSLRANRGWLLAAAGIVAGALALRLWGIGHGLPYVYNADENAHFVPRAIGMFGHSYNPDYFVNPPAYTYLLHVVFDLRFGGRAGVGEAMATDRTSVFETARIVAALLGTVAVALLAWAGRRLTGGAAGLIAGALLAVAFLPVHYSHLALNDAPTLAPVCLALLGVATIYRHNGYGGYAIAGPGARRGLRDQVHGRDPGADDRRRRAGDARARAADPRAAAGRRAGAGGLPRRQPVRAARLRRLPRRPQPPVGGLGRRRRQARPLDRQRRRLLPRHRHLGARLAAGAVRARRRARAGLARPPAGARARPGAARVPRLHGHPGPLLRALAAARLPAAVPARGVGGRWRPRSGWRPGSGCGTGAVAALLGALLCVQGLVFSVHNDVVLARDDTRQLARDWMVDNIPIRSKVVIEPFAPAAWAADAQSVREGTGNGFRWNKWPTTRAPDADGGGVIRFEDYERTTRPALLGAYARGGFCWVVTGSTQYGRAFAEPGEVPDAIRYYAALERDAELVYEVRPDEGATGRAPFSYDFSFNAYPLAYDRMGPEVRIYRLRGGKC